MAQLNPIPSVEADAALDTPTENLGPAESGHGEGPGLSRPRMYRCANPTTAIPLIVTSANPRRPRILSVNQAFVDLVGYPAEELVGRSPALLFGELKERLVFASLRRELSSGRTTVARLTMIRKDGSSYLAGWCIQPTRGHAEEVDSMVCTLSDPALLTLANTAVPAPREAPREESRPVRTDAAVLLIGADHRIGRVSPAAASLLGIPQQRLTGVDFHDLGRQIGLCPSERPLEEIARGGGPWEGRFRTVDGRHLSGLVHPIDDGPYEDVSFVAVLRDETESRRIEVLAETVSLMNHTGYVFAGIRHELGNPVNSIKTGLSVLRNHDAAFSAEKRLEYYDRMLAEVSRIEYLLKGLRTFNAHECISARALPLADLFESLWRVIRSEADVKGLRSRCQVSKDVRVLADERALYQALLNLLTNAMEALEDSPDGCVELFAKPVGDLVNIEVRDNGPGMNPDALEHARRPFFTTKANGTGLGLAITQRIVSRMGGTLTLQSLPGLGTTARIQLARASATTEGF